MGGGEPFEDLCQAVGTETEGGHRPVDGVNQPVFPDPASFGTVLLLEMIDRGDGGGGASPTAGIIGEGAWGSWPEVVWKVSISSRNVWASPNRWATTG